MFFANLKLAEARTSSSCHWPAHGHWGDDDDGTGTTTVVEAGPSEENYFFWKIKIFIFLII